MSAKPDLDRAREFVYREARVLERRLFATLFEDASPDGATAALLAYRNADGGFGHGLEPDTRCPDSQPLDCQVALETMLTAGVRDVGLAAEVCDFLAGVAGYADDAGGGGVPMLLPSIAGYPRAPHWSDWAYEPGLNPTAGIVAALYALGVEHAWLERATDWCFTVLERTGPVGDAHTLRCVFAFLDAAPDQARADGLRPAAASALAGASFYRADPADRSYGVPPTELVPAPDSRWRSLFDDELFEAHLDRLAADQQPDGGWPVTWETLGLAATFDARGAETMKALRILRAYDRL